MSAFDPKRKFIGLCDLAGMYGYAAFKTEYGGTVVHDIFENHALSEADARAWGDQYDDENSPRVQFGTQHTPSAVPPEPAVIAGIAELPETGEAEHEPLDKHQRNRNVEAEALLTGIPQMAPANRRQR